MAGEMTALGQRTPRAPATRLLVEQIRSPIGTNDRRRNEACLKGLGLGKIGRRRALEDTPAVRGMIHRVHHLVRVIGKYQPDGTVSLIPAPVRVSRHQATVSDANVPPRPVARREQKLGQDVFHQLGLDLDKVCQRLVVEGGREAISDAVRALRSFGEEEAMATNPADDEIAEAIVRVGTLPELLYERLFSGNQNDAEMAARALVISARNYRGQFNIEDIEPASDGPRQQLLRQALIQILHDSGDRYYSYLNFTDFDGVAGKDSMYKIGASLEVTRALPFLISGQKVLLPPLPLKEIPAEKKLYIVTDRNEIAVEQLRERIDLKDGELFFQEFLLFVPASLEQSEIEITLVMPGLFVETHELTLEQMRNEATAQRLI